MYGKLLIPDSISLQVVGLWEALLTAVLDKQSLGLGMEYSLLFCKGARALLGNCMPVSLSFG